MFMAQASIWKVAIVGVCVWDRYSEEYVLHWRALVPVRRAEMRPEVRLLDPQRLAAGPADAGGGHFHVHPQRRVGPRGWDRKHTHTLTLSLHTSLFHSLSLSLITLYCLSSSFFHLTVSLFLLTNFCLTRSSILFSFFLLASHTLSSSLLILSVPLFLLAYYCALSFFFSTSLLPLFPSLFFFLLPLSTVFSSLYECYSLFSAPLFFRRLLMIDWWVDCISRLISHEDTVTIWWLRCCAIKPAHSKDFEDSGDPEHIVHLPNTSFSLSLSLIFCASRCHRGTVRSSCLCWIRLTVWLL